MENFNVEQDGVACKSAGGCEKSETEDEPLVDEEDDEDGGLQSEEETDEDEYESGTNANEDVEPGDQGAVVQIDVAVARQYFDSYDLDGSGTINSAEELTFL